jgi:hydrogenase maturation protease
MRIAVIGIGQSLRGDDAVGLEAVRQWQENYPETANRSDIQVDVSELPGLALLDLLDGSKAAILVDAVKCYSVPGTIHTLRSEQLSAFTTDAKSAHGWGVAETLRLDRMLNPNRQTIPIQIIGVEVGQMQVGNGLSKTVEQALPRICEAIQNEVQALLAIQPDGIIRWIPFP